jgi:hypothetical protein
MVAAPSGPRGGGLRDEDRARGGIRGGISGAIKGGSIGGAVGGPVGGIVGGAIGGLAGALGGRTTPRGFSDTALGGFRGEGGLAFSPRGDAGRSGDQSLLIPRTRPAPGTIAEAIAPPAPPAPRFTKPSPANAPAWARFEPVMTDLQRRSYMATEGLSGNQGLFRSGEAKDYYKNLLGQMFISPLGEPQGDLGQLLPIEQQYLMALGVPEFQDVPGLLTALGY